MPPNEGLEDHPGPPKWYDYVLASPFLVLSGLLDTSRVLRCKMLGHRPVYGQINYGYCNRCHRHL